MSKKTRTPTYYKRHFIINITILLLLFLSGVVYRFYTETLPEYNNVVVGVNDVVDSFNEWYNYKYKTDGYDINEVSRANLSTASSVIDDYENCSYKVHFQNVDFDVMKVGNEYQGICIVDSGSGVIPSQFNFYAITEDGWTTLSICVDEIWYEQRFPNEQVLLLSILDAVQEPASIEFSQLPTTRDIFPGNRFSINFYPNIFNEMHINSCGHIVSVAKDSTTYADFRDWGLCNISPTYVPTNTTPTDNWEFLYK